MFDNETVVAPTFGVENPGYGGAGLIVGEDCLEEEGGGRGPRFSLPTSCSRWSAYLHIFIDGGLETIKDDRSFYESCS